MHRLIDLLRRLRGPDGCPWDRAQTSQSLAPFLLEETYELLEAISRADDAGIREELGDLLLHVAFQAELARERGAFTFDDVVRHIVDKLSARHAHLLGGVGEAAETWETRKARQRGSSSILDGVTKALPALSRAWRCQQRAAEVGFEWPTVQAHWAKVMEEVGELEAAVRHGRQEEIATELGHTLFVLVGLGRHVGLVAEDVLHEAVTTFTERFAAMEHLLAERGIALKEAGLEVLMDAWDEVKRRGREGGDNTKDRPSTEGSPEGSPRDRTRAGTATGG